VLTTKTKFISSNTRMGLQLKITSTVWDYWLLSAALLEEQCPMSVLHLQCITIIRTLWSYQFRLCFTVNGYS
jgi:hypothetical protein